MNRTRRALVLTDVTVRHPFRRGLPLRVRRELRASKPRWHVSATDVREFLMAYCACFMAVSTFLL